MMTEDEARKKWCPHVRHPQFGNTQDLQGTRCIASECMAWRSKEERSDYPVDVSPSEPGWEKCGHPFQDSYEDGTPSYSKQTYIRRLGYCGLAGAP